MNKPAEKKERWLSPLFTWRSAVASKESNLDPTSRHVALTLSLHMSERGDSCFPSVPRIVDETGLARSTVIEHLAVLNGLNKKKEQTGEVWLEIERGGGMFRGKRYRQNTYTAVIPNTYEKRVREPDVPKDGVREPDGSAEGGPPADEKGPAADVEGAGDGPEVVSSATEDVAEAARAEAPDWASAPDPDEPFRPVSEAPPADLVIDAEPLVGPKGKLKPLWADALKRLKNGSHLVRYRFKDGLAIDFTTELTMYGGASESRLTVVAHWIPVDAWPDLLRWQTIVTRVWAELIKANGNSPKDWPQTFAVHYPRPGRATRWTEKR